MTNPSKVSPERLQELQAVLRQLDPAGRLDWTLEIYTRRNGADKLSAIYDLKTGEAKGRARAKVAENG
jgi:hypothetical protein